MNTASKQLKIKRTRATLKVKVISWDKGTLKVFIKNKIISNECVLLKYYGKTSRHAIWIWNKFAQKTMIFVGNLLNVATSTKTDYIGRSAHLMKMIVSALDSPNVTLSNVHKKFFHTIPLSSVSDNNFVALNPFWHTFCFKIARMIFLIAVDFVVN